jgi:hypothetical protein
MQRAQSASASSNTCQTQAHSHCHTLCLLLRRDLSSLEKIYEYFATQTQDGRKVMSAQDVVRALVPTYPPVGSDVERAGFLDGE